MTPKHIEEDHTPGSTVLVNQQEEHEIAIVKETENFKVKSSSKRSKIILIEKHFKNSKAMIFELGNVEFFELCETFPKVRCSHCLLRWNQGIEDCTCGQCLIDSESRRKFNKPLLDALTIPNYVIKKGRCHEARHGKTEVQREYHLAWNAWERCCEKVDSQGEHFTSIQNRFLSDLEKKCKGWDEFAKEDRAYHLTPEEKKRYQGQWYPTLNTASKNGLMKLRSDFRVAVWIKIVYTTNQKNKLKSVSMQINKDDGIHLQAHRGGTRLNGIGSELTIFFFLAHFLSQLDSFAVDSDPV